MSVFYNLFSLNKGAEDKEKVREDIVANISFRGANLWILACAILIASIGLNMNSTAVIIGAMLISPLMGPIVGSGFALATYDFNFLKRSVKNLLIATLVGLIVSSLYFFLSPFKDAQSEILSRTSPTIYDVLIAFFGGIVGAVSITRIEKGNPIPGVAIATALMPPLCTAGFGIAHFNMKFVAGALYLYSINCFFIGISTFLVIKYLKYPAVKTENTGFDKKVRVIISVLMLLMIIPSSYLAYSLLQEKKFIQNAEKFIQDQFTKNGYTVIYKNINYKTNPKQMELAFLSKKFDSLEIKKLNKELNAYGLSDTELIIKANNSDLKKEILSEITKSTNQVSDKDIQIQNLLGEIDTYQIGNKSLDEEIKIIFPDIDAISFGTVTDYSKNDSLKKGNIILYQAEKSIDEAKLKAWLERKFGSKDLTIIKK